MADLVERARKEGSGRGELDGDGTDALLLELADEIERLLAQNDLLATGLARREAEIERLKAALRRIADHEPLIGGDATIMRNVARAALEEKP